ncbi:hypothetical protein DV738_g2463, partial [Chaetothyriales sp. CBS 135597]
LELTHLVPQAQPRQSSSSATFASKATESSAPTTAPTTPHSQPEDPAEPSNGTSAPEGPEITEASASAAPDEDPDEFVSSEEARALRLRHYMRKYYNRAEKSDITTRRLDDEELDSGDDEHRNDRVAQSVEDVDEDEDGAEFHELRTMHVQFARLTRPVGDELYLVNLPPFLGLSHMEFHPSSYEAPTKPHDASASTATATATSTKFSAYDTAMSTIYWRHDPKSPSLLQSNARIIRWSDGSLTLQLASDPTKQYALSATPLHQNYNPKTNTLSPAQPNQAYDPTQDSNNYLVAPHATAGFDYQIVRPLDAALKVLPTADQDQAAKLALQQALHKSKNNTFDPFTNVKTIRVDPEKAKRDAERAEKEIAASKRIAANAQDRDLNHETQPRGRTKEDEYDREDDFVAASDEELETYEEISPKRNADHHSPAPDGPGSPQARKKRRVIDDDDDDE